MLTGRFILSTCASLHKWNIGRLVCRNNSTAGGVLSWVKRIGGRRRCLLTYAIEPPDNVPERPCTVVLSEDSSLGGEKNSWEKCLGDSLPTKYGLSFCSQFRLSHENITSFDDALTQLKYDLSMIQQPVLVANGPWISWMAQFYLESMPLAGLIMVDPLILDQTETCRKYEASLSKQSSFEYKLLQDYTQHYDHWTLRLEPGSVPMMILSTTTDDDEARRDQAQATAQRHATETSPVPVVEVDQTEEMAVATAIGNWIEDAVL